MKLTEQQKVELLKEIQEVLPGAQWAPNESWLEEGQNAKKAAEPVFFDPTCDCVAYYDERPATLTLFVKAAMAGQHYNVVRKAEMAIHRWASKNLIVDGCRLCRGELTIDLRLFRIDEGSKRFPKVEEEDLIDLSV